MKKVIFTLALATGLMFAGKLSAQHQHTEVHKLDKEIKMTLDSAQHSMVMFILKQDTTQYRDAVSKAAKAKVLTKEYKALADKEKGLGGRSDEDEAALYIEEINLYSKPKLKETVLADKKKTEKFKYKGETYMV